jgi:hypothetical protein
MSDKKICELCGGPLQMYYKLYCPKCEPPELQIMYYYNLMECYNYIEFGLKEEGFRKNCESEIMNKADITNDSYITLHNDEPDENPYIAKLFECLKIEEDEATFHVSW